MKLERSLLTLLVAALLPAPPVEATVDSTVTNLNLTLHVQGSITEQGDVQTGQVAVVRLGAKQIIELLEDLLDTNYPSGARLYVTVDGDVWILDKKEGELLEDVSEFISADLDFTIETFKGTFNLETEQEKSTVRFLLGFLIDIPDELEPAVLGGIGEGEGIQIEVFGAARENFTGSKPKANGTQTFQGSIKANLAGAGFVDGADTVAEGSVTLNGKETVELE